MPQLHPSDSAEQRALESAVLPVLASRYGVSLAPERLDLGDGVRIDVDGIAPDRSVIVEIFGHVGPLKSGQRRKLATDALKLGFLDRRLHPSTLILAVVDFPAMHYLSTSKSWPAAALRDFGITVVHVPLEHAEVQRILAVQARQAGGMARSGALVVKDDEPAS